MYKPEPSTKNTEGWCGQSLEQFTTKYCEFVFIENI